MRRHLEIPTSLAQKAKAEGDACVAWLADLPGLVEEIESQWDISVGDTLPGGTASFVADVSRADGTGAVLKVAMPASVDGWETLESEAKVLEAASGRGTVRLISHDARLHALLVERLGRQLAQIDIPLDQKLSIVCDTLTELWDVPPDDSLLSGAGKAEWLATFITEAWELLQRPCPVKVIDHALRIAERRADAFKPERAVLVHGDAHVWNTLEDPCSPGRFRFVDPDGLFADPEYDLAISMREYNDDLLAGSSLDRGRARARHLADLTATDPQLIWEWGYLERVSTGLLLIRTEKNAAAGLDFLRIAEVWATG